MKVFHYDKYRFVGIERVGGRLYYAFKCVKVDFDPEIVLVTQARVLFPEGVNLYFDSLSLKDLKTQGDINRLCVNQLNKFKKCLDLAENESKRCDHRTHSEVITLIHGFGT